MLAGQHATARQVDLINVFEAVGAVKAGKMTRRPSFSRLEECACPGCGSCAGMFTANSMNCLTEALGHGPARQRHHSGRARAPAIRLAKEAGMKIMELWRKEYPAARDRDRWRPSTTPWPWTWPWAAPPTPSCTCRPSPTRRALSLIPGPVQRDQRQTPAPLHA